MNDWLSALQRGLEHEAALMRVTVASVRGSAPREPGACMLVGADAFQGSIGGGHLELKALEIARRMLRQPAGTPPRLDRFALGATLGQCCGGAVNLWFERYDAADGEDGAFIDAALTARDRGPAVIATAMHQHGSAQRAIFSLERASPVEFGHAARPGAQAAAAALLRAVATGPAAILVPGGPGVWPVLCERVNAQHAPLWLFGAGHVGRAVVGVFSDLPFDITWIDSRHDVFPARAPANVTLRLDRSPVDTVALAPRDAWFLVMTHSHDLDYAICRAILRRDDYAWAGLIGSETKATCFALRYARENIPAQAIARLTCPIGAGDIRSKLPGAIAVSVAAQLLQALQARETGSACATSARAGARR